MLAAQTTEIPISFVPVFNSSPLFLNSGKVNETNNEYFTIETLKFYVSKIELFKGQKRVYTEPNSFHLLDIAKPNNLSFYLGYRDLER